MQFPDDKYQYVLSSRVPSDMRWICSYLWIMWTLSKVYRIISLSPWHESGPNQAHHSLFILACATTLSAKKGNFRAFNLHSVPLKRNQPYFKLYSLLGVLKTVSESIRWISALYHDCNIQTNRFMAYLFIKVCNVIDLLILGAISGDVLDSEDSISWRV